MRITAKSRAGFTLIEIMVAMALTLFVMVIMSQAFVIALDTFSGMKGIGDMQQNLRVATVLLRDDLAADHFEGKRRLSDVNILGVPPQAGFFAVRRSSLPSLVGPGYISEGNDGFGVPSYRASDQMLYMTVKKRGNRPENFFTASLPESFVGPNPPPAVPRFFQQQTAYDVNPIGGLPINTFTQPYPGAGSGFYASQWTEVLYYMIQTGTTEEPRNPNSVLGTPIFGLYRAQFVMLPDSTGLNGPGGYNPPLYSAANLATLAQTTFAGMSCNSTPTSLPFYSPIDAAKGSRVIPDLAAFNPTDPRVFAGATLVCPNVVSFHVQVMPVTGNAFVDLNQNTVNGNLQPYGVYDSTTFDPSSPRFANYANNRMGLKAIQVTIRVWDSKTRQTRQVTMVQDL